MAGRMGSGGQLPKEIKEEYKDLANRITARRLEKKLINDYAELQATLRKIVNSLAYLSLTWSTVVLLGGFVSVLKLIDFWFLTAISTSFALNLADLYECNAAFPYAALNVYIVVRYAQVKRFPALSRGGGYVQAVVWFLGEACLGILIVAASVLMQILAVSPLLALALSLVRLVVNSYGNAGGGDAANATKLRASLQIFYSLALAQNTLLGLWCMFKFTEQHRAGIVRRRCALGRWATGLVLRYARETRELCATQGQVPQGRSLVTFAVALLGSESLDERRDAVRLLDKLVLLDNKKAGSGNDSKAQQQEDEEAQEEQLGLGPKLAPCKVPLENLLEALEVGDVQSRERAARVVLAVASDLRHNDWCSPKALHHIASLLEATPEPAPAADKSIMIKQLNEGPMHRSFIRDKNMATKLLSEGPIYYSILYYLAINRNHVRSLHRKIKGKAEAETEEEEGDSKQEDNDISASAQRKRLITQGLLIIERLALHQGNRVHICNNHALLSRLTGPLYSHALLDAEYDDDSGWTDMLGRSLRIVARLIKTPGEASRGLRDDIASNKQAVLNLTGILEDNKFCTLLKTAAIEIIAELASHKDKSAVARLDKDDLKKLISQLWGIFFAQVDVDDSSDTIEEEEQREKASRLRQTAGEALALMLSMWDAATTTTTTGSEQVNMSKHGQCSDILEMFIQTANTGSEQVPAEEVGHVVGKLTDMVNSKHECSRTRAAQILACLCSHLTMNRELESQYVIKMLKKVFQLILVIPCKTKNRLEMDFQVMICSPRETNIGTGSGPTNKGNKSSSREDEGQSRKDEEQQEEKGFLVALLSLAVVICNRMVDAHDFACAAPEDMASLVKKLKDIIQTNNTITVECLQTVKLSCQLVISIVQLKPTCLKDFIEDNFMDVLSESSKILSDLDNCLMLFDVNYLQVTNTDKPLVSLVKQAQKLLTKHKKPGDAWNLVSII